MSSANIIVSNTLETNSRSWMWNRKRRDSIIYPNVRTNFTDSRLSVSSLFMWINFFLLFKYFLSYLVFLPSIPCIGNFLTSMFWSTMWNALDRSINTLKVKLFCSKFLYIWSISWTIAWLVKCSSSQSNCFL